MTISDANAALKNVIAAWENTKSGYTTPREIQRWLIEDMKPAIDDAREFLRTTADTEQDVGVFYDPGALIAAVTEEQYRHGEAGLELEAELARNAILTKALKAVSADVVGIGNGENAISDATRLLVENALSTLSNAPQQEPIGYVSKNCMAWLLANDAGDTYHQIFAGLREGWNDVPVYASPPPVDPAPSQDGVVTEGRWPIGTSVRKIKGSSWNGRVVGYYSTTMTPVGYAVESEREPGSVQIYPAAALALNKGGE